jgi:3-hydroxybutyrate dehydrogenase
LWALGVRAQVHGADLRQPAQIAALIEVTQRHDGLDILVNNAVVRYFEAVENSAPDHWDEALAVNLLAPSHAIPSRAEMRKHRPPLHTLRPRCIWGAASKLGKQAHLPLK